MAGLIHLYCGDGKGKTTAACGLAARMLGHGKRVVFAQFFKDGTSGELAVLRAAGAQILCRPDCAGFFFDLSEREKAKVRAVFDALFAQTVDASKDANLLVLDECAGALSGGLISEAPLFRFLTHKPEQLEVVLTGRDPSDRLISVADYVSEIVKIKHPYDRGVPAREGAEY